MCRPGSTLNTQQHHIRLCCYSRSKRNDFQYQLKVSLEHTAKLFRLSQLGEANQSLPQTISLVETYLHNHKPDNVCNSNNCLVSIGSSTKAWLSLSCRSAGTQNICRIKLRGAFRIKNKDTPLNLDRTSPSYLKIRGFLNIFL